MTHEKVRLLPGELRDRDVRVGRHVAISPDAVPRFLRRFAEVYGCLGKTEAILSSAAAHDRLLWIYPFKDDNGRLARLISQPALLRIRILQWAEEETRCGNLPAKSGRILEAVLYRGELARGDADTIVGAGERQARRIVSSLLDKGVLVSESPRAPLHLVFPAALASRWVPGLFPEKPS